MKKSFSSISLFLFMSSLVAFAVTPYLTLDAFAAQPTISTFYAIDPDDGDAVFGAGDTITIRTNIATNATVAAITDISFITGNFTFASPNILAGYAIPGDFTAAWVNNTALVLTFVTTTNVAAIPATTVDTAGGNTIGDLTVDPLGMASVGPVNLSGNFGLFVAASVVTSTNGGGSGCTDCEAPTLGLDDDGKRLVDNGFSYNGNAIDVERYFTPYPLVIVSVGKQNVAEFKIYDDKGPDSISHFELAFGLANGESIGKSKAVINWDKTFDGIETVTIDDPENVLDKIKITTSEGYCSDESQQKCLIVKVIHTFRAPLDFNILGTNVWDAKRNAWQNYYNHGIEVVGESLNPAKEYDGINKGHIYHLTETSKTSAVDEFGNSWSLKYGLWNKDIQLHKTPVTLFLMNMIPTNNGFAGSDQFGTMYYLTQTSEIAAVDMFGNNWSLESGQWTMDSVYSKMILDSTPMGGYTRADPEFNMYKYGQSLLAENKLLLYR